MVKLGNNFSEKNNGKAVSEDGFDTIPLITPLDASQLQFPPPDKVRCFAWCFSIYMKSMNDGPRAFICAFVLEKKQENSLFMIQIYYF